MKQFRYDTSQTWFKGNTHVHSIVSDGAKNFMQLSRLYADKGYDFLFRTDHWVLSDVLSDREDYPLLWLDGIELDGLDESGNEYHVVCLGQFSEQNSKMGFTTAMNKIKQQGGLLILAHPQWTGNTFTDALQFRFNGVEVYNHLCENINGTGSGSAYWREMLKHSPEMLSFASDDTHLKIDEDGYNGGWVVINAPELAPAEVMTALRRGNYYSSTGPEFFDLKYYDSGRLTIRTSSVRWIRLCGPGNLGINVGSCNGKLIENAEFIVPDWDYCYVEIVDENNLKAWTNTIFIRPQMISIKDTFQN
jgi:hypothetical protein